MATVGRFAVEIAGRRSVGESEEEEEGK